MDTTTDIYCPSRFLVRSYSQAAAAAAAAATAAYNQHMARQGTKRFKYYRGLNNY